MRNLNKCIFRTQKMFRSKNFFLRLNQFFPSVYSKWESGQEVITVNVNGDEHDLSGLKREDLLTPVNIEDKRELVTETRKLLRSYNSVAKASDAEKNIDKLKTCLMDVAETIYPSKDVEVYLYGSRTTGLAEENSDVDIFLDIDDTFHGSISEDKEAQIKFVESFKEEMNYRKSEFKKVVAVKAGVPIVQFEHVETGLKCDLSFRSGMSTMNSKLVKLYLDLDPRVKFVVVGVKIWMKWNELDNKNGFSSYAQIWLALFFLMQKNIAVIPSLEKLREIKRTEKCMVEDWNCAVPSIEDVASKWKSTCSWSDEELLRKFFVFYSGINMEKILLCTFTGVVERRKGIFRRKPYREFFMRYSKNNGSKALADRRTKLNSDFSGFCLQDPLDHVKNITKNMDQMHGRKAADFIILCGQTVEILRKS